MAESLRTIMARFEERQIAMAERQAAVIEKIDEIKGCLAIHQDKDDSQFKSLNDNVNNLHKYAASVAIVASAIGGGTIWLWNKITGA